MKEQKIEDEFVAHRIGTDIESFSPDYSVLTVSIEIIVDGEEVVLSLQREFGDDADEPDEICLVFSPSQQCAFDPLTKLFLNRNSLSMNFTTDAANVFDVASLRIKFEISDDVFNEIRNKLELLCAGKPFYLYED